MPIPVPPWPVAPGVPAVALDPGVDVPGVPGVSVAPGVGAAVGAVVVDHTVTRTAADDRE
ncbi:hypothetical protein DEJ03_14045 [Curtobacterium sp. MCLR17_043]|nr:hypothetical protein DEJ03_14045 [Curtobacterium sp. MCLR17_043]